MNSEIILNEDEQDCLQELMNIAYGSATAAITEILDAFATLSIPKIKIIDTKDLKKYLSTQIKVNSDHFVSIQQINGLLSGENLFIIDRESSNNIAHKFGLEDEEINDDELSDIILEITNILSSSTISTLAQEMNTKVSFSPPDVKILESIDQLDNQFITKYEKVIIISTELNFKDLNIKGELLIFTTDDSIMFIKDVINTMLEEL